jgi:hypothetical protein
MRALTMDEVGFVSGGETVTVWGYPSSSSIGIESSGADGGYTPINGFWGAAAGLLGDVASEVVGDWLSGQLNKTRPSQTKATEIRSGVQNKSTRYIGRMDSPDRWGNMIRTSVYKDTFGNAFFLVDDGADGQFEAVVMSNSSGQRFQWSGSGWDPYD